MSLSKLELKLSQRVRERSLAAQFLRMSRREGAFPSLLMLSPQRPPQEPRPALCIRALALPLDCPCPGLSHRSREN